MLETGVLTEDTALVRCRAKSLDRIKQINCWGLNLSDISIVQYMSNVEVASFSVNAISTLKFFSYCPRLTELYIRRNAIATLEELRHLQQLRNLRSLWLSDNPCCEEEGYREKVLSMLPQLQKLDNIAVIPIEAASNESEVRLKRNHQRPASAVSVESSFSDAESIIRKSVETPIIKAITTLLPSLDVEGLYIVRSIIDKRIRKAERLHM